MGGASSLFRLPVSVGRPEKSSTPIFRCIVGFVCGIIGRLLPDDGIQWIKIEHLCSFLPSLELLEFDLYLYLGSISDSSTFVTRILTSI